MAKIYNLEWDTESQRTYETGVSTGVLYLPVADGKYGNAVAWNGLTSVSQSPEGAEANDIYADNIKYLSLVSAETFNATIEAYTYPDEFAACDGSIEIGTSAVIKTTGIRIGQQKRSTFAFSYVTKKGDANNNEWDIIHIIYGCKAAPSERSYETVNDSPEAITFSWEINTTGTSYTDSKGNTYKGICHIEIDTSKYAPQSDGSENTKLAALKKYMYGTPGDQAENKGKCPTPDEVVALLTTGELPPAATPEVQE